MPTRRGFIIALALTAAAGPSIAAEQTAQEFLAAIYANYKGKDAKGTNLGSTAAINRLFVPSLARIIDADMKAAAKRGEVGTLDGDPFINAQDFDIDAVAIDIKDTAPDKATGTVKFKNLGTDTVITYQLVKLKQGWRIDDIKTGTASLRAQFKKR